MVHIVFDCEFFVLKALCPCDSTKSSLNLRISLLKASLVFTLEELMKWAFVCLCGLEESFISL